MLQAQLMSHGKHSKLERDQQEGRGLDRRRKLTLIVVTELELCFVVCFGFDEFNPLSPEVGRFSRIVFD